MSQSSQKLSPAIVGGIAAGAIVLGAVVFWPQRSHADLRDWSAADHDQGDGPSGQAAAQTVPQRKPTTTQETGELVELAWSRNCATCHGGRGRGDGPQGPMLRAPDLTRADWQGRVTDDDIAQTIRTGRNKMPKFDLPPTVVDGLVKRIRANRAK